MPPRKQSSSRSPGVLASGHPSPRSSGSITPQGQNANYPRASPSLRPSKSFLANKVQAQTVCPRRLSRPLSWPIASHFSALQTQGRFPQPEARSRSRLRPGLAPGFFSQLRLLDPAALALPLGCPGSTAGLFVRSWLAGMGLILSLAVLGCVSGDGKVLGALQSRLLLLPRQQRCPGLGRILAGDTAGTAPK